MRPDAIDVTSSRPSWCRLLPRPPSGKSGESVRVHAQPAAAAVCCRSTSFFRSWTLAAAKSMVLDTSELVAWGDSAICGLREHENTRVSTLITVHVALIRGTSPPILSPPPPPPPLMIGAVHYQRGYGCDNLPRSLVNSTSSSATRFRAASRCLFRVLFCAVIQYHMRGRTFKWQSVNCVGEPIGEHMRYLCACIIVWAGGQLALPSRNPQPLHEQMCARRVRVKHALC